jgi:hypothetical protein
MIWPQVAVHDWSGKSSSGNLGIEITPSQDSNKQAIKVQVTCPSVSKHVEYETADNLDRIVLGGTTNLHSPPGPPGWTSGDTFLILSAGGFARQFTTAHLPGQYCSLWLM